MRAASAARRASGVPAIAEPFRTLLNTVMLRQYRYRTDPPTIVIPATVGHGLSPKERGCAQMRYLADRLWALERPFGVGGIEDRYDLLREAFADEERRGWTRDALKETIQELRDFVVGEYRIQRVREIAASADAERVEIAADGRLALERMIDVHVRSRRDLTARDVPDPAVLSVFKSALASLTSDDPAQRDHLLAPMTPRQANPVGNPHPRILKAARARLADAGIAVENRDPILEAIGLLRFDQ